MGAGRRKNTLILIVTRMLEISKNELVINSFDHGPSNRSSRASCMVIKAKGKLRQDLLEAH